MAGIMTSEAFFNILTRPDVTTAGLIALENINVKHAAI